MNRARTLFVKERDDLPESRTGSGSGGHDGGMTLEITVRGEAQQRYPAERGVLRLEAAVEGADRGAVRDRALAIQEPLVAQLIELSDLSAVGDWSTDQVRVFSHHPWVGDRRSEDVVHTARISVVAEFVDFERLSGFVDHWAAHGGVEIQGIEWDLGVDNRRAFESDVRRRAVDDAVAKAQAFADAVRRGRVTAVQLADPGMLDSQGGGAPVEPRAYRMVADATGGSGLVLAPADIEIRVEVDARFVAD